MTSLRASDLRAALDFLERINGVRDLDAFAETLVSALDDAIPADVVAYNEVNPAEKRAFFMADPPESIPPDGQEILEQHMDDNPLVVYTARTGDGRAIKWSDFVTQRELRRTALWNRLFRPSHLERQMVAVLPAPHPLLIGVVLMRCGRDFSERDRALLNLLRPHLSTAYRNAQASSALAALEDAHADRDEALIVIGSLGEPLSVTPRAYELLPAFGDYTHGRLPERLLEWCRCSREQAPLPAEPIVGANVELRVEARFLTPSVVYLSASGNEQLDPRMLESLGLAPREREVLALVAEGYTNRAIGERIGVEAATVKKHLERIYVKLGVGNRTAAAAAAFRAAEAYSPASRKADSLGHAR